MSDAKTTISRREFLRHSSKAGVAGAKLAATGAAATVTTAALSGCDNGVRREGNSKLPLFSEDKALWTNWAGNQHCYPQQTLAPTSEGELAQQLANAKGKVRAVGAGHSFSAVVPTNDTLISTDLLTGLESFDSTTHQATLLAGTRLYDASRLLDSVGQAFINLPDMDYPSLAGAVVNSVHGTGINYSSMSAYVSALNLVTPQGEILECSAHKNADLFQAARCCVGSLGIISKMTVDNVPSLNLTERTEMADVYEVLENIDQHFASHRNFELFAFPLTSRCAVIKTDEAKPTDKNAGEEDAGLLNDLKLLYQTAGRVPLLGPRLYEGVIAALEPADGKVMTKTGKSYEVLCHKRMVRFREMEYTVAVEDGPACLKEILATIKKKKLPLNFPIEYRHVKRDDIWLSMFQGQDGASISIHQHADWQYQAAFAEIEAIFHKYNGRPHWGKLHTLNRQQLADLYPQHWQDFQTIRQALDPQGKMLNAHLNKVFLA